MATNSPPAAAGPSLTLFVIKITDKDDRTTGYAFAERVVFVDPPHGSGDTPEARMIWETLGNLFDAKNGAKFEAVSVDAFPDPRGRGFRMTGALSGQADR